MFPVHIVAAVNKTLDVSATQHAAARAHILAQEGLAERETARLERSHEQVSASAPEDRLELSPDGDGLGGGGGNAGGAPEESGEEEPLLALPPPEGHIDFLA